MGMMTSIGHDAITACASYRAGIARADEYVPLFDPGMKLMGYPVEGVTNGYQGLGRLLRLATPAIEDLRTYNGIIELDTVRSEMTCHLALPAYPQSDEDAASLGGVGERFYRGLTRRFGLILPSTSTCYERGQVGGLLALKGAIEDLESGRCTHALVGGVASYFDEDLLVPLLESGRVKSEEHPAGLMPGEAAAFVLLERRREGISDVNVCARLLMPCIAHEPIKPAAGVSLGNVVNEVHAAIAASGGRVTVVVSDINGEPSRSNDWGCAVPRLHADLRDTRVKTWMPTESFGDTDAASAIIGVCAVARGFARGYVQGDAIVTSASDDGGRGAVAVMRP